VPSGGEEARGLEDVGRDSLYLWAPGHESLGWGEGSASAVVSSQILRLEFG
jgi:hypothetical protein